MSHDNFWRDLGASYGAAQERDELRAKLTRIREAAGPEVRALSHWLSTVPIAVDSEYSRRADALRALLRAIDGEQT